MDSESVALLVDSEVDDMLVASGASLSRPGLWSWEFVGVFVLCIEAFGA